MRKFINYIPLSLAFASMVYVLRLLFPLMLGNTPTLIASIVAAILTLVIPVFIMIWLTRVIRGEKEEDTFSLMQAASKQTILRMHAARTGITFLQTPTEYQFKRVVKLSLDNSGITNFNFSEFGNYAYDIDGISLWHLNEEKGIIEKV